MLDNYQIKLEILRLNKEEVEFRTSYQVFIDGEYRTVQDLGVRTLKVGGELFVQRLKAQISWGV